MTIGSAQTENEKTDFDKGEYCEAMSIHEWIEKGAISDEIAKKRGLQELVRCKDCKHREESVSPSWEAWCNRLHCGCDDDWFCADGERKD
jgi:hypothetical protein